MDYTPSIESPEAMARDAAVCLSSLTRVTQEGQLHHALGARPGPTAQQLVADSDASCGTIPRHLERLTGRRTG
jgi:hypothetical protein